MKILVQPYTQVLSHTIRPLLVAQELRARGHEVVFGGGSPKAKFIEKEGFTVVPMYEPDAEILWRNIRGGKIKFIEDDELDRMIESDLAVYREIQPEPGSHRFQVQRTFILSPGAPASCRDCQRVLH